MKEKIHKAISIVFSIIAILNMTLYAMGKSNQLILFGTLGIIAIYLFFVSPHLIKTK